MRVVGLGAWCDYVTEEEYRDELLRSPSRPPARAVEEALAQFRRSVSFRVREFAVLANGCHLTLSADRGFSGAVHRVGGTAPVDPWDFLTVEELEADVRTTVLPDDDEAEEEHPWAWLAERPHARDVDVPPEQLKELPYDVVFSQRLRARVGTQPQGDAPPWGPAAQRPLVDPLTEGCTARRVRTQHFGRPR